MAKSKRLFANILSATFLVLIVSYSSHLASSYSLNLRILDDGLPQYSSFMSWMNWIIGDISEAQFYKNDLASLGLLLGAFFAYVLYRKKQKLQGFAISYGTGLFLWILLSSSLGLILSNLLWSWTIASTQQWQPTFVTFVSLPAATVLMYGKGYRVAFIGAISGALLITPLALLFVNYICRPLDLPNIIGNVSAMAIGSLIAFRLFYAFPSMMGKQEQVEESHSETTVINEIDSTLPKHGPFWVMRRMIADFSESQFFANEWAGLGFIAGVLLAIYINPLSISYGSDLIVAILISQILSAAIAVVTWQSQWEKYGWYPTYIPISSVAPVAVLVFNGSQISIVGGAIIGAIIAPPLAHWISTRLPNYQHPYIGNVISMAIVSLIAITVIRFFN
ncbi:hypothetical protein [Acinetobacter sp. ANC 4558]|uniref:hypothetical protein n=1 Tax=Acinetobacter sp. ANC 4558 TaxID=1977876 RepID=UPI001D17B1BE|nr:hypothetical protein [Acinetobacter sp. ANC 4558]